MADNYYSILELEKNCSQEDIEKNYKKLALRYHPDRNPGDTDSASHFIEVQKAYDTLKDPHKRRAYDNQSNFVPFASRMQGQEFEDLNIKLTCSLTFEESVCGTKKLVTVHKKSPCSVCAGEGSKTFQTCPVCNGRGSVINQFGGMIRFETMCAPCMGQGKIGTDKCTGCNGSRYILQPESKIEVTIPAGVTNGMTLSVNGAGHIGKHGNAGNILVACFVVENKKFQLKGLDICFNFEVDFSTLVFGGKIEIPTFENDVIELEIPEKTQSLTNFRVKGKGFPSVQNNSLRGDLIATVVAKVPNKEFEPALKNILKYHGI